MIKAIALDIDNTLIARGSDEIFPSALQALKQCRQNGLKLVIATGRCYCLIQPDVKKRLLPDLYITINGAGINDAKGQLVTAFRLFDDDLPHLREVCRQQGLALAFKYDETVAVQNDYEGYCSVYCTTPTVKDFTRDDSDGSYWQKHGAPLGAFIIGDNQKAKDLGNEFDKLAFVYAYPKGSECYRKDLDKGRSLEKALSTMNITLQECIAFGDSPNDIAMLKAVGCGIAMGNSDDETKAVADEVTADLNDDGIAKALKAHGLI